MCVSSSVCAAGQLVSPSGICYWCPLNEYINNGRCECLAGFTRVNEFCTQRCPAGKFLINGVCGVCVMGTVYSPALRACVCDTGYYMNSYQMCEVIRPTTCDRGFFLDGSTCVACPAGCATCNANACLTCLTDGFWPVGRTCQPRCGDGIMVST